ncbi:hypothetical protein AABB24_037228 [Solanum stoloniferum]|uniref:Uncharacterized protein n=1 Tax=Solanum stoloniferum TaxID=62892 RepID=A0ABD2R442_9SOLN
MQSKINSFFNSSSFMPKSADSSKFCSDEFNYKRVWKDVLLTYQRRPQNSSRKKCLIGSRDGLLFLVYLYRIKNRLLPSPVSERSWTLYTTNSSAVADFLASFLTIAIGTIMLSFQN